jgi:hypothetical protein
MVHSNSNIMFFERLLLGFIAGFLATLIFHQLSLAMLWGIGLAPFPPFSFAATKPFNLPAVFSLSIWGGIWGILFALIERLFTRYGNYWVIAFLFGAILPSLVALFVVLPLKGKPMGGGWHAPLLVTALIINGAWGFGTGLILRIISSLFGLKKMVQF